MVTGMQASLATLSGLALSLDQGQASGSRRIHATCDMRALVATACGTAFPRPRLVWPGWLLQA
jgi:hypothetical protein